MKIIIMENNDEAARAVADRFEQLIEKKPDALVCIAGGHSPVKLMQTVAADAKEGRFNAKEFKIHIIGRMGGSRTGRRRQLYL